MLSVTLKGILHNSNIYSPSTIESNNLFAQLEVKIVSALSLTLLMQILFKYIRKWEEKKYIVLASKLGSQVELIYQKSARTSCATVFLNTAKMNQMFG